MNKDLFFEEREHLRDEAIIEGERMEREQHTLQELYESERKLLRRGVRIFRSDNRVRNRAGKKHLFFPHYPKEFLPF